MGVSASDYSEKVKSDDTRGASWMVDAIITRQINQDQDWNIRQNEFLNEYLNFTSVCRDIRSTFYFIFALNKK